MTTIGDGLLSAINQVAFRWRHRRHRPLPGMVWAPTPREERLAPLPPNRVEAAERLAERLAQDYDLPPTRDLVGPPGDLLAVAELVEALLNGLDEPPSVEHVTALEAENHTLEVLEVGPAGWEYAPAMHGVLSRFGGSRRVRLTGIEIDPYVPCGGFRTRREQAEAAITPLPDCHYLVGDVRDHAGRYDRVIILFPIMRLEDALGWGLPASLHDPASLLRHCFDLLLPGGALLVSSFGYEEEACRLAWESAGLAGRWFPFESGLRRDLEPRRLAIVRKSVSH